MGNRMCGGGCRKPVEERLTRPQRLIRRSSDVDFKKLRKLILSRQLAPCFDALEEPNLSTDLEECPICFFHFPSLNRSACCSKGICTECFVQMKPSDSTYPAHAINLSQVLNHERCPFCKSSCFAIEYRGAQTEEEKYLEHAEEQKVIEAKIRIQCESQAIAQATSFGRPGPHVEVLYPVQDMMQGVHDILVLEDTPPLTCNIRVSNVEFEEIMVMEAIWQSLQDSRSDRNHES